MCPRREGLELQEHNVELPDGISAILMRARGRQAQLLLSLALSPLVTAMIRREVMRIHHSAVICVR